MRKILTHIIVSLLVAISLYSCKSLTSRLHSGDQEYKRLGLSFAKEDRISKKVDSLYKDDLPEVMQLVDKNGKTQTLVNSVDNGDGTTSPLFVLQEVKVIAKMKSIPERNGQISMDFIITVPKQLINDKWQLRVYPRAFKTDHSRMDLEPLVLSGADFLKLQEKGYQRYKQFITSIIPDSLYWKEMVNRKGYNKALADLEQDYYNAWKKDLLLKDEWIDWREKVNRRYVVFNKKMKLNRLSIDPESSLLAILPAYWLERDLNKRVVPTTFAEYAWGNKSIVKKKVSAKDSIEIERKFTDIKKIAENERKKQEKEAMFNKLVKFPKIRARLDSIVQGKNDFKYYYTQSITADEGVKKIKLVLNGEVVALDMSTYDVPRSDTLTYNVSAMVDFIDASPRYKTEVVYRNENKSVMAKIEYKVGSSQVDLALSSNKEELEKVKDFADDIVRIGDIVVDSLTLYGYASPEGTETYNRLLSEHRTHELKRKLLSDKVFANLPNIKSGIGGENWSGLLAWIKDSTNNVSPMTVATIVEIIRKNKNLDTREKEIKTQYPDLYKRMTEECYPSLRMTEFRFYTHRPNMVKDTIHTSVIDDVYNQGREFLKERKYKEAMQILNEYPTDYNLAICNMSLGYNKQAINILRNCSQESSNVNYLLAILMVRENRPQQALSYLLKSVEIEKRKIYRAQLDPELNSLIVKYGLFKEELDL